MHLAVFTKNRSNPAYAGARVGADRVAAALGARAVHYVPTVDDDPDEQSTLIDHALATRPDAVVLIPVHPTRVAVAIGRLAASGVPIATCVNRVTDVPCVSHVGSDDTALGEHIATYLFAHLGGRGDVLLVAGPRESVTSLARLRGVDVAAARHPGIRRVATCHGDYRRDRAADEVDRMLAGGLRVDAVLAANDVMALGAVDAFRRRQVAALPPVVGINAIPEAIDAIAAGDLLATADFNAMAMAALATECAIRHLRGEVVPAEIELPARIVDRSNASAWQRSYGTRPIPSLQDLNR